MSLTYSRMSNLALEFFFFDSHMPLMFSVVTHLCPYSHELEQMDKRELSMWCFISMAF